MSEVRCNASLFLLNEDYGIKEYTSVRVILNAWKCIQKTMFRVNSTVFIYILKTKSRTKVQLDIVFQSFQLRFYFLYKQIDFSPDQ
jgi:hypothetical protein